MSNRKNNVVVSYGVGFTEILFLVFLVLKLTGVIDWSWWWITAPLWGGFGILLAIFLVGCFFIVLATLIKIIRDWYEQR
jgi:hypothetical protein